MLNIEQFRELIVKSTLNDLQLYSKNAEELLIFTCATESMGGTYLKQIKGPALGIYQMEPNTYNDIWQNYLKFNMSIVMKFMTSFHVAFMPPEERMIYDLRFATAMARFHYRRVDEPLPPHDNIGAIWEYYKKYYNTPLGKADREHSIKQYELFVGC